MIGTMMKDINEVIRSKQLLRDELARQIKVLAEAMQLMRDDEGMPVPSTPLLPLPQVQVPGAGPVVQPKPPAPPQPVAGIPAAKAWP